ncbi:hypothetical protein [Actinomadura rubrisoli]|uniref:Polysaccharide chain length determinant N-terminal domain-containing protein n=1 Tax=Actinomadura rubrisoli TaxID=2530368 RepID=A0A4R5BCE0_9ACTN|nr:hypothetical protein [Actinomadura rubrisoli]TDD82366.1 hypothetical protein E1298_22800 [Actinomadura rubrisoli]
MAVRDFLMALRRNIWVTLVAVVLTAVVVVRVETAAPSYEARSVVTFLSPQSPFPRNSFASFTPALVTMAEVSARWLDSPAGRDAVRAEGGDTGFQVVLANRGNQEQPIHDQPYLTLLVKADDPVRAHQSLLKVLGVLRDRLRREQSVQGAQPGSYISWQIAAGSDRAVPVIGRPSRAVLAVLLIGGIGALYAAVTADRRRSRRRGAPASA